MLELKNKIKDSSHLHIQQMYEHFELLGFETRNKYQIHTDAEKNVAFAAEVSTGFGGAIARQILKHWRTFRVTIFDDKRQPAYTLHFPFRWFLKTLYVSEAEGRRIGHMKERFAFFRKKFDVYDVNGVKIANIDSSFFRLWTFEFKSRGKVIGKIEKKWAGALSEFFTDKDNFLITFTDPNLTSEMKILMLSTCLLVDIVYFENNKAKLGQMIDFS